MAAGLILAWHPMYELMIDSPLQEPRLLLPRQILSAPLLLGHGTSPVVSLSTEVQTIISVTVAAVIAVVVGYYFDILPPVFVHAVNYGIAAMNMPRNVEIMHERTQEFASTCAELVKAVTSFDRPSRDIQNAASGLSAELEKWITGQQKEYSALADPIKQCMKSQGVLDKLLSWCKFVIYLKQRKPNNLTDWRICKRNFILFFNRLNDCKAAWMHGIRRIRGLRLLTTVVTEMLRPQKHHLAHTSP